MVTIADLVQDLEKPSYEKFVSELRLSKSTHTLAFYESLVKCDTKQNARRYIQEMANEHLEQGFFRQRIIAEARHMWIALTGLYCGVEDDHLLVRDITGALCMRFKVIMVENAMALFVQTGGNATTYPLQVTTWVIKRHLVKNHIHYRDGSRQSVSAVAVAPFHVGYEVIHDHSRALGEISISRHPNVLNIRKCPLCGRYYGITTINQQVCPSCRGAQ